MPLPHRAGPSRVRCACYETLSPQRFQLLFSLWGWDQPSPTVLYTPHREAPCWGASKTATLAKRVALATLVAPLPEISQSVGNKNSSENGVSLCCPGWSAEEHSQLTVFIATQEWTNTVVYKSVGWVQWLTSVISAPCKTNEGRSLEMKRLGWAWWLTPVIATLWDAKASGSPEKLFFWRQECGPGKRSGTILTHCDLCPPGFKLFLCLSLPKIGFCYVGHTGLNRLASSNPPASATLSVGISGVSRHTQPRNIFLKYSTCKSTFSTDSAPLTDLRTIMTMFTTMCPVTNKFLIFPKFNPTKPVPRAGRALPRGPALTLPGAPGPAKAPPPPPLWAASESVVSGEGMETGDNKGQDRRVDRCGQRNKDRCMRITR
ncbi:hypothetical protein AAY473_003608 [Plecturocebus cupreus]